MTQQLADKAAVVLKSRCWAASPHRLKQLWCSKAAAGLQAAVVLKGRCPLRLAGALVFKSRSGQPSRSAPHCLEAALVLKSRCGLPRPHQLEAALLRKPVRAASPHCLEAALVLGRCGLPARVAGSGFGARRPLPARTACKHLWC